MNLTEPLRRRAAERPAATAYVRPDGTSSTYRELDQVVDHVAHRLSRSGIVEGDIVITVAASHFRGFVLQVALARIGAAAASPTLHASHATAYLVDDPAQAALHERTTLVDDGWFDAAAAARAAPAPMHRGGDTVAIVIQSSGTTSAVKNIALTHRMFLARHAAQSSAIPLPAEVRQICVRRPSSSYGFSVRMRALAAGGTIVHATTEQEVIAMTERFRVTRLSAMPFWLERIAAALPEGSRALATLEQVEVGGSFVPDVVYRMAVERVCRMIYTNYGVTEAGFVAGGLLSTLDRAAGEVGRLAAGVVMQALDADGRVLPAGETGTLRVRCGDQQAHSYVDALEASRATFQDGWIMTGDVGRVTADGRLYLGGRESENIDIGGYKVHPRPIEDALRSVHGIVDAATFGVPGPNGITVLGAAIVTRGEIDRNALEATMRLRSPGAAPAFLMRVTAIPRNEAGKVLRRELVAQAIASGAAGRPS